MALTEEQLADIRSRIPARPETDIPMPYEDLVRKILTEGTLKSDRTGTGTISLFGQQMRFDLSKYFPLLTTKTVFFKGLAYELLWFLKGSSNINWLLEHNVHIWDEWADENGDLMKVALAGCAALSSQFAIEHTLGEGKGAKIVVDGTYDPENDAYTGFEEQVVIDASDAGLSEEDADKLKREKERTEGAANELAQLIGVSSARRLEAFDISHISGYHSVASMVVFENGRAKKNDYRKFKLRTIDGPDDYASMREVLTRRFTDERFNIYPDVLMMDGGRGQVNIALEVLDELGLNIPVCGMVKDDHHRTRGLYYNNKEIDFPANTQAFNMITRLQDEAHRFAIEYHRSLRSKSQIHSVLDDIEGIGPARRKALLAYFKDIDKIRAASIADLEIPQGMNKTAATAVYNFFHNDKQK